MGFFSWVIFGFLAGALAKFVVPGKDPGGCLITTLLGVVGASVGGFIGTQLGWGQVTSFDMRSLGLAMVGAIVLLLLYRMLFSRKE